MKNILLILFYLMLSSCILEYKENRRVVQTSEVSNYTKIQIKPGEINKSYMLEDAISLIDTIEYIALETTDSSLIGDINELYFKNNQFYIFDRELNQILVYDSMGRFIRKIGKVGLGPGEYITIQTICVDSIGAVSVYCDRNQSVIDYSSQGDFLKKESVGAVIQDFYRLNNRNYFYTDYLINQFFFSNTFPKQYRLFTFENNEILNSHLEWEYNDVFMSHYPSPMMRNRTLYDLNGKLNLIEPLGYTSYEINDDGSTIKPKYVIDFGKYNFPVSYDNPVDAGYFEKQLSGKATINRFIETEDHLMISYVYKKTNYLSLFDKIEKRVIPIGPMIRLKNDGIVLSTVVSEADNKFVFIISSEGFKIMLDSPNISTKLKERFKLFSEIDNPVLVIVKFK